jgi:hypothetical protein
VADTETTSPLSTRIERSAPTRRTGIIPALPDPLAEAIDFTRHDEPEIVRQPKP